MNDEESCEFGNAVVSVPPQYIEDVSQVEKKRTTEISISLGDDIPSDLSLVFDMDLEYPLTPPPAGILTFPPDITGYIGLLGTVRELATSYAKEHGAKRIHALIKDIKFGRGKGLYPNSVKINLNLYIP